MRNHYQQLKNCEQAFRLAGIVEAYSMLNLATHLETEQNSDELAKMLGLHPSAFERFLNTTTFLTLTEKLSNKIYRHKQLISYSSEPTHVLIDLVEEKLPDRLCSENWAREYKVIGDKTKTLLEKAAQYGLIEKNDLNEYQLFEETKRYLLSSSKEFIGAKLFHYKKTMLKTFDPRVIINALKENKSQWQLITGEKASTAFDLYQKEPELLEIFTRGMHQLNANDNNILAQKIRTDGARTVLDIGGGSGAFALAMLEQNPTLQIFIYEHPHAISLMEKILRENATADKLQKIKYIAGNFLINLNDPYFPMNIQPPVMLFHIICMTWILHDWPDETCVALLKKTYNHLEPDGQLIIAEEIQPENQVSSACIGDLTMLLHTDGKERKLSDYKKLLMWANFEEKNITLLATTETRRQLIIAKKGL